MSLARAWSVSPFMYASVGSTYMVDAMMLPINAAINGAFIFVFVAFHLRFSIKGVSVKMRLRCSV
jgi:hypothetical protein